MVLPRPHRYLVSGALLALGACTGSGATVSAPIEVFYAPSCSCCGRWVSHLEENGFEVAVTAVADVAVVRRERGVPPNLAACHTAFIGGYFIEGHVPAADIRRLLAERPAVQGLAVPGMPSGSPGMSAENPIPYNTLVLDADGNVEIYARHEP